MDHLNLGAELAVNAYPGRGIVIGKSGDGKSAVIAYFIMGRSANSRNRVFTAKDGGIITEAADPAKLEDPSLIIYAPVRVTLSGDIDAFTAMVWNSLNEDNKVSLFVRYIDLKTGKTADRIVNRYEKVTGGDKA